LGSLFEYSLSEAYGDSTPCDPIFSGGSVTTGSGECGWGNGKRVPPDTTVDLTWDHRAKLYVQIPSTCSGASSPLNCWLGVAMPPTASQAGALNVRDCGSAEPNPRDVACALGDDETVSVSFDTTGDEATIEIE
jgi:hypothetical protein